MNTLTELVTSLSASPWSCISIVLLVFLESAPVIGLLIPGVLLLPALGTLSAHGIVDFRQLLLCGMLGALAADSLGYWLGRLGHTQWHRRLGWYRSRHLQKRVDKLFARYGVMALFVGRFMWLIHPMVPMAAGVAGIRAVRFYIIDLSAALLWLSLYFGGGHGLVLIWRQLGAGQRLWMASGLLLVILVFVALLFGRKKHD